MKKIQDVDLKSLIEQETGERFNKEKKIHSPFNPGDKNPSFSIYYNANAGKMKFKDFSTGEEGDCVDFIMKHKNIDYKQARAYLGLPVEKTEQELQGDKVRNYIEWEIEKKADRKDYKLVGLFPFVNENNNIIYYKAKFLKPDGKKMTPYYHIGEDGKVNRGRNGKELIYNFYNVLKAIKNNDVIIITEGEKNANRFNMLFRNGYCSTSVKGLKIEDLQELDFFNGAKIYVCGDSGKAGQYYKDNIYKALFKNSKSFKIINLPGLEKLGDNKDIEDYINAGHNRNDVLKAFDRSLDLKDIYQLQQDKHGIYKLIKENDESDISYRKKYISNFNIVNVKSLEYVDEELSYIETTFKDEYGEEITRTGSVTVLDDLKSFKAFLRSPKLTFEGKSEDLIELKKWINKYFIDEYYNVVNGNQFREVNGEVMYISPNGALKNDGNVNDYIKSDGDENINVLDIEPIGSEELEELMQHLFNFSEFKNSYTIIGTIINDLAIYQGIKANISFPHLLIVGESGSGKSTILKKVVGGLLNYSEGNIKSMSTTAFAIDKILCTGNYPAVFDEYKPQQFSDSKNKSLSDTFRNSYDRATKERGQKDQTTKKYRYCSPLIIAGEESFKGDEKAAYERSCIVYLSKAERTEEHTNNMNWIIKNNSLLNKLGKEIIKTILNIGLDEYRSLREMLENTLRDNYSYLEDRPLNNVISACTGIEILNKILIKHGLPVIKNYLGYIADNMKTEVIEAVENDGAIYEKIFKLMNNMLEIKPGLKDTNYNNYMVYFKDDSTYIRLELLWSEYSKYIKEYNLNEGIENFKKSDFGKQIKKAGFVKNAQKKIKIDRKAVSFWELNADKLLSIGCNEFVK